MTRLTSLEDGAATLHSGLIERAVPAPVDEPASGLTPVLKPRRSKPAFDLAALAVKPPRSEVSHEPPRRHVRIVRPVEFDTPSAERPDRCPLTLRVDRGLRERLDRERAATGSTIQAFLHRALTRFLESRSP